MSDLTRLTLAEARDRLRARDVSSVELTEACLTEIEGAGALNAFVHNTPEIARAQAATPIAPAMPSCTRFMASRCATMPSSSSNISRSI